MSKQMSKTLENQMKRYNALIDKTESLRYQIETELESKYLISSLNRGFRTDEVFDLKECCSDKYDIEKIKNIINAINLFEDETGEYPEKEDLENIWQRHQANCN